MPVRPLFYICRFFPRPTGATYSSFRLACALRDKGAAVSYLCDENGAEWRDGGTHEGFPVRSFALQETGKLRKLRQLAAFTRHLRARRKDFDVFHVHGGGHVNLFLSLWVRLLTGKPTMMKITLDGWDTPDGMRALKWGRLALFAYRRLTGVVAMTSGQAEKCRAWKIPGHLEVIPNGVDCDRYRPADPAARGPLRDALGLPRDALVLVYVGWLGARKGTDVLIRAWLEIRRRHPGTILLLVGDYLAGRGEGHDLEAFLTASGLPPGTLADPGLRRVGHVEDAERYLQAADVFVFPSRQEGFGTVQIEAMACGLPCVVNDLPGVSIDIFPDETCGFRIADNNVEAFIQKLDLLASDPARRETMGRAGRARAVARFSLPSVADRYLAFYRRLPGDAP